MRPARRTSNGLTVRAVSGTHVVFLAFDLTEAARKQCLGFAIKRRDVTEDEEYWLDGLKTFEEVEPTPGPGAKVSTHRHPVQGFQWADYTAKPKHQYKYTVVAMYGTPKHLTDGPSVTITIDTESAQGDLHDIHFNRGAVASQEYARRFQNRKPNEVKDGSAYQWLSRGLEEALFAFVGRADSKAYSLRAAIYEFQWPNVLKAFKAASDNGADVQIVFDAVPGETTPAVKNRAAIKKAGLTPLCIPRTKGKLMHNKFIVLLKNKKPVAVWTGSTNVTENGIFGHLNVGHAVESAALAARFLEYWEQLANNPDTAELKEWAEENDPVPEVEAEPTPGVRAIFSPHRGLQVLKHYAHLAEAHSRPIFITLAFGMHDLFKEVYRTKDGVLRAALLEKEGNGAGLAEGKKDIQAIRNLPNVLVAIGHNIVANRFDRWLREIDRVISEVNVRWVHTKFLLVDPLSDDPVVVTGSANFSGASTDTNAENMLIIRGNTRVADIYFTEFLRIYSHHAFRESLTFHRESPDDWKPQFLETSASKWQQPYFKADDDRCLRRVYYIGA